MAINGQQIYNFANSPAGQAAIGAVGSGLQAYGQAKQDSANREQNAQQFAANKLYDQYNADQNRNAQIAQATIAADPLGQDQRYAQRNALLSAILPNLRNAHSTPGDAGVASAMGQRMGGLSNLLGENGLDPQMIQRLYGDQSTANAITQHHQNILNLNPNAAQPDLTSMYGAQAAPQMAQLQNFSQQLQQKTGQDRAAYEQGMNNYINQMVQKENEENNSGGFWHKFAKIAAIAGAGVATVMTAGGASPLLVAAISAGAGAAGAWGNGQSPLMGAVMGGAGGYAGAKFGEAGNAATSAAGKLAGMAGGAPASPTGSPLTQGAGQFSYGFAAPPPTLPARQTVLPNGAGYGG